MIMEAGKSKISRLCQLTRDPGELILQFQGEGSLLGNYLLPRGAGLFLLFFCPSTD